MLTLLVGGPQDGKVAETWGSAPAALLEEPRRASLLDEPTRTAYWVAARGWYELVLRSCEWCG